MRPPSRLWQNIFAVSDLHTDYPENMEWALGLRTSACHKDDVLIVAGDVSDKLETFSETMHALANSFGCVCFVPGNHDLWLRRDGSDGADSLAKLDLLNAACAEAGVFTTPQRLTMASGRDVSIIPMVSLYHSSWDVEPEVECLRLPPATAVVTDYRATAWPAPFRLGEESLAVHMDERNEAALELNRHTRARPGMTPITSYEAARSGGAHVLSFSHFLPSPELLPEKRYLRYPPLSKAVGSVPLRRRVGRLKPHMHVFGHSHFGWDATLDDGVRYVQAALATPRERRQRPGSLQVGECMGECAGESLALQLYDGKAGQFCEERSAAWSDHYREHARRPNLTFPAPWVLAHYAQRAPLRIRLPTELASALESGSAEAIRSAIGQTLLENSGPWMLEPEEYITAIANVVSRAGQAHKRASEARG